MATNKGKLAGRTVFITGASRGIGKAIALKLAKDGANIVIAAKTAEPHPKLHGTIYTAAKEVEEAGGKALPCVVDIRNEAQVEDAVRKAVDKFGGIDILVNNASAISLTGTLETPVKRYDLMNDVNTRGTYLCSRACLPYLIKGRNPHILNISPPLNMSAGWFKGHVAYTMAKYGMSMCALGMAEEFRDAGVAVNTLWPRTTIFTAAIEVHNGSDAAKHCRKVDVMADSAYLILTQDSRSFTGNFCMDDEVLLQHGVKDLSIYDYEPGSSLLPDLFLGEGPEQMEKQILSNALRAPAKSAPSSRPTAAGSSGPAQIFQVLKGLLSEDLVQKVKGIFQFDISGSEAGTWYLDLKNGSGAVGTGKSPKKADCTMAMDSAVFSKLFAGKIEPTFAVVSGKVKIKGNMGLAPKLQVVMQEIRKSQSKL